MNSAKETILRELEDLPEGSLQEVLDFVRFLRTRRMEARSETVLLSEDSLSRDWLRPEEDEAWKDL